MNPVLMELMLKNDPEWICCALRRTTDDIAWGNLRARDVSLRWGFTGSLNQCESSILSSECYGKSLGKRDYLFQRLTWDNYIQKEKI